MHASRRARGNVALLDDVCCTSGELYIFSYLLVERRLEGCRAVGAATAGTSVSLNSDVLTHSHFVSRIMLT